MSLTIPIVGISSVVEKYFGLKTNHSDIHDNGIKCYFSSRQKDNGLILENGRYYSFVNRIKDSNLKLNRWKLITPAAYGFKTKTENTYNKIGQSFVSSPGEVCT